MKGLFCVAAVAATPLTLTACGSESEPASIPPATNAPLSTLPPELASSEQGLDTRLAAIQPTLDIYAANGFDVDTVSADPAYGDVSKIIGASLRADVVNATSDTRVLRHPTLRLGVVRRTMC